LDAIAYAEDIAKHQFLLAGIDPAQYETVYVLQKSHMGYTFHKSTDPRVLRTPAQSAGRIARRRHRGPDLCQIPGQLAQTVLRRRWVQKIKKVKII
jgi:hypothetical protein